MISEAQPTPSGGGALDYHAPVRRSSPLLVALAWAVVAIPAAWGIAMTAKTSVLLFKPAAPAPAQTAPVPPGPQR